MNIWDVAMSIMYFALLGVMLYSVKVQNGKLGVIVKLILGLLFVVPVVNALWTFPMGSRTMAYALSFCLVGDIFLGLFRYTLGIKWEYYKAGVLAFIGAQILYFIHTVQIGGFTVLAPIVATIGTVGFIYMNREFIKTSAAWLSMCYSFALLLALTNIIFVMIFGSYSDTGLLFTIGMILFFISDYVLFYIVFDREHYKTYVDYINKSTYYIGQFIIMLSIVMFIS